MRNLALVSLPVALFVLGCSDDGGGEGEGSGSTGSGSETSAEGTDTTNGSADDTSTGGETSAETSTSGPDTGSVDESGSESETGTGTECREDGDCILVDDCCSCTAIPADGEPPPCDIDACIQTTCAAMGLVNPPVQCGDGVCELVPVSCDESLVTCESLPPECPGGFSPGVDEETACWTGGCVANTLCDPSCGDCTETQACVRYASGGPPQFECVDIPEACDGTPTCACMGDIACEDPFTACNESPQGLECACPACSATMPGEPRSRRSSLRSR